VRELCRTAGHLTPRRAALGQHADLFEKLIVLRFREYLPTPDLTTKSTFGDSCPGRKPVITRGSPVASASAIAPGPALVTMTSQARISSGM